MTFTTPPPARPRQTSRSADRVVLTPSVRAAIIESLASLWYREDVAQALATHDIATVYKAINCERGISQRTLAALTERSQSEIAGIIAGRQVQSYPLLVHIANSLGIPRWRMGLSTTPPPSAPPTTTANAWSGSNGSADTRPSNLS